MRKTTTIKAIRRARKRFARFDKEEAARIASEVAACDAEHACIGNEEARIEAAHDHAQWLRDHEDGEGLK